MRLFCVYGKKYRTKILKVDILRAVWKTTSALKYVVPVEAKYLIVYFFQHLINIHKILCSFTKTRASTTRLENPVNYFHIKPFIDYSREG
jgi:hypothetical protein